MVWVLSGSSFGGLSESLGCSILLMVGWVLVAIYFLVPWVGFLVLVWFAAWLAGVRVGVRVVALIGFGFGFSRAFLMLPPLIFGIHPHIFPMVWFLGWGFG